MERKDFLRGLGLVGLGSLAIPILSACGDDDSSADSSATDTTEATDTGSTSGSSTCSTTPSETAGPFPTKSPSSLIKSDITSDRTGVPFTINITIQNKNASCAALAGAIVDIWHCDKDGYYSEYGGTGMQSADFTAVHFLRGRQTTNTNGKVSFTSIFPGWYSGRATHIHVHIYNSAGTSLLVTQIAFPEGSGSAVVLVNASTANGYTKGMSGYTYNASDNVFSDGVSSELSTVTGSVAAGFVLTHSINVAG
jgi:protocatechuate 3,4-dioxygenase beta subunit